jgi:hypothetical protein
LVKKTADQGNAGIGWYCVDVRVEGLEPPCRKALDPKSSVSANFTTPAFWDGKGILFVYKPANI